MLTSMTAFASRTGQAEGYSWNWDMRSVNGRGLDLRLRLPDWVEGLEAYVRPALQRQLDRGSVTLSLKLSKDEQGGDQHVDGTALRSVLGALSQIESAAIQAGVSVAPPTAAEILQIKGIYGASAGENDTTALRKALLADLEHVIGAFKQMRRSEGAALHKVISEQVDRIEALVAEASGLLESRQGKAAETLRENLARVLENTDGADPDRVAQELALIAVKTDVTEEMDRLRAHVVAARELIAIEGPVGRKLDFLTQEFNREANTLCSKAQFNELTRVGLDLKAVIDQMREQVQNVE
ncbi:MAG: YicC family protein [Rhodobacteraceae bacterium]|nr:YicC family protein [Paracoccaceae bacterium]